MRVELHTELIETPIWPEDMRTTKVANIKKEAASPGPTGVRPITLAATLYCVLVKHKIQRSEDMGQKKEAWLHKPVHGGIPGFQECRMLSGRCC